MPANHNSFKALRDGAVDWQGGAAAARERRRGLGRGGGIRDATNEAWGMIGRSEFVTR
jgi:hypothetical protein